MRACCSFGTLALISLLSASARAGVVIEPGSSVTVRASNNFGFVADHSLTPTFGLSSTDSVTDTEAGTLAVASSSATYNISLSGTTATFSISPTQSYSIGAFDSLAVGSILFTVDQPTPYSLSGFLNGTGSDAGDAYQQRTFLRRAESPFNTIYLEDETTTGVSAALAVNQTDDTAGGTFNQSGVLSGVLVPGLYEFAYRLESSDADNDGAGSSSANGRVVLTLEVPEPQSIVLCAIALGVLLPRCRHALVRPRRARRAGIR